MKNAVLKSVPVYSQRGSSTALMVVPPGSTKFISTGPRPSSSRVGVVAFLQVVILRVAERDSVGRIGVCRSQRAFVGGTSFLRAADWRRRDCCRYGRDRRAAADWPRSDLAERWPTSCLILSSSRFRIRRLRAAPSRLVNRLALRFFVSW